MEGEGGSSPDSQKHGLGTCSGARPGPSKHAAHTDLPLCRGRTKRWRSSGLSGSTAPHTNHSEYARPRAIAAAAPRTSASLALSAGRESECSGGAHPLERHSSTAACLGGPKAAPAARRALRRLPAVGFAAAAAVAAVMAAATSASKAGPGSGCSA